MCGGHFVKSNIGQLESSLARKGGRDEGEIERGRKGWEGQTAVGASQQ